MKTSEIRDMSVEEAKEKLAALRKELAKQKAVIASGTRPENPGKVRSIRKDIARILTIINEKEKAIEGEARAETEKKGIKGKRGE